MNESYDLTINDENQNPNIDLSTDIRLIIDFLDELRYIRNYSGKTITNYMIDLRQFLNYLSIKGKHTEDMDRKNLRRYISYMHKEKFEIKSIHRKISSLKSFYKHLTRKEIITNNPALTLPYPKLEKKLPTVLSVMEVESLLDEFQPTTDKEIRDKCIIEMLYATGMRVSELTGINIGEADTLSKSIKVKGKGNKERLVFLNDRTVRLLREYQQARLRILNSESSNVKPNDVAALFITLTGNRIHPSTVYQIVKIYSKLLVSGKKISPHTFRHSFATHIMNNGADIRLVQELLGHESISSTQIYTHVSKDRLRDIYRKFHPHGKG
jgi:site-specific recombinase XerD